LRQYEARLRWSGRTPYVLARRMLVVGVGLLGFVVVLHLAGKL
jgi:hypothetical protein